MMYTKQIFAAIVLACIGFAFFYTYQSGYVKGEADNQTLFDKYKAAIDDQVAKAKINADKIQHDQEVKYADAQVNYYRDVSILTKRLRESEGVLCGQGQATVRVDGGSSPSVPTQAEGAARVAKTFEATASARPTFYYNDAIEDAQQCSALIEWVKAQGM